MARCAICGNDTGREFTNPKRHKLNCSIYVSTERVVKVIVRQTRGKIGG